MEVTRVQEQKMSCVSAATLSVTRGDMKSIMEVFVVEPGHCPRHSSQQVSSSFFLLVTPGQGRCLNVQLGTREPRR